MQCHTELIAPTAVTHAVTLPFLGLEANNLVVAKTSLLQVFSVKAIQSNYDDTQPTNGTRSARSKLVLIGEYPLSGTVTSLASVKALNTRTGGEAILVAFQDAKLSLIEWDPEKYRISTVSIHFYEGENVINQPFGPSLRECESILTVDPSSRCAALKFGARHLAILPFQQIGDDLVECAEDGFDADMDTTVDTRNKFQTRDHMDVDGSAKQTPYSASFVLPMTALDPALTHPVHLAFLHEYREPTFGILSAPLQSSTALLAVEERKDCLTYTVFTLDLEQRASTNLISVPKLPSDLWKVVPLALPIGGALLVGTNEFVHVDQSGKTTAVAVNEFATNASNCSMVDQSSLNMKLEDCEITTLDRMTGELLVVLNDGSLAVVSCKMLGRNVGGLTVSPVSSDNGGSLLTSAPTSLASLRDNKLFVGSEDGASALLGWSSGSSSSLSRKRSHAQMLGHEPVPDEAAEDADDDIDEDDLYAPSADTMKKAASTSTQGTADKAASYVFTLDDEMSSLGPINHFCLGKSPRAGEGKLEMVAGVGKGRASQLAFMSREIIPHNLRSIQSPSAKDLWSVSCQADTENTEESANDDGFDNMLFVYDGDVTRVYDINNAADQTISASDMATAGYTERIGSEFESEGETLSVFNLARGTKVVQCRPTEIRTYEPGLGLSQIIPQADEETDVELRIVATSTCDPYLLVLRDDSSVQLLQVVDGGDVEPFDLEGELAEKKWLSGCLYTGELTGGQTCAFLLSGNGGLHVFSVPNLQLVYSAATLAFLPPVLTADAPQRRGGKATLTELLVADLGTEGTQQSYLVARTAMDDLALYEPFHYSTTAIESGPPSFANLRFRKVPNTYVPKYDESLDTADANGPAMLKSVIIGNRSMIYIPGGSPSLIIKEATSLPKMLGLRAQNVNALSPVNRTDCRAGFALVDRDGHVRECQIPPEVSFATGWSVQTLALGEPAPEVRHLAFHEERGVYVVAACRNVDFYFTEEEGRHTDQDDITMRPQIPQYTIHVLSAETHRIIDSFDLPYADLVTALKVIPMEVSEHTHEVRSLLVVGTTAMRGEDMPAKGTVTVFDIISVVPEPEEPETGIRLHVLSREETKGAITAVESFPGGLLGTAQGQKIMIRGLKDDGYCLPVAFLDAQCHITELKTLGQSGMWLAGDAWKGLWFGGFTEEPYRLSLLGKSLHTQMEVVAAEFLPFDGQLFIMVIDARMDLHVLQYDPENPKSMSGLRLLHKSTFHLGGHFPTQMALLPSTLAPFAEQAPLANGHAAEDDEGSTPQAPSLFHILITSQTGAVSLLTPVDEATYRRLSALQTHLTSILEHAAGLNPRAYRAVESEGSGARGLVDGSLVQRIGELGAARRAEVLGRAGADAWGLRSDLEILGGGGLGYL